ncbi:MAG: segregation and condensation protein A [Acidimicrobiales bacterium]
MSFQVQTEAFEGPFDLLLHLILADDVDLYEVRLSDIVDAYLAELERLQACDLEVATEFLLIAATLVELKCRRLLPNDREVDLDEELALWEERDLLLARLLECKTFKDAAQVLAGLIERSARSLPRRAGLEDEFLHLSPDPLAGVTPAQLRSAFLRVATAKPVPQVSLAHVNPIRANVTDAIADVVDQLLGAGRQTFRQLTRGLTDRIEVVVRFLAVLELFKQDLVDIDQARVFGDLTVDWIGSADDRELAAVGAERYDG